jgi:hypothetical protein
MDRSTMIYKGAIDKLTNTSVKSILNWSIRGSSLAALVSTWRGPICGPKTYGCNMSLFYNSFRSTSTRCITEVLILKLMTNIRVITSLKRNFFNSVNCRFN